MKKILLACWMGFVPVAHATSPFDGTWVWDAGATQLSDKPHVYLLDRHTYLCKSCEPAVTVPADSKQHAVTGHSRYDALQVVVTSPQRVKLTFTKANQPAAVQTLTVVDDGKHLIDEYEDRTATTPVVTRMKLARIQESPAGAHAVSGSWRETKIESVSDNGSTVTLKVTNEQIFFSDASGIHYEAHFDGKEYPMMGDATNTMVSVRRIDEYTFEETQKHDGKVDSVIRLTVHADGKTAEYIAEDRKLGSTTRGTLYKKQ